MSEVRRVLRWEIPIDDEDHESNAIGPVLHVAGHRDWRDVVEVWTLDPSDEAFWAAPIGTRLPSPTAGPRRVFRVFGTGQPVPAGYVWRGTGVRTVDGLMWHLFERAEEPTPTDHVVHVAIDTVSMDLIRELRRLTRATR